MKKMDVKAFLAEIKHRYFRPVIARPEGILTHFGMCDVYRAVEVYGTAPCTCGFNLDLKCLSRYGLIDKLNPKYWDEESQKEIDHTPVNPEEAKKILEAYGLSFNEVQITEEEKNKEDQEDWQLITEVFGKDYTEYLQRKAII